MPIPAISPYPMPLPADVPDNVMTWAPDPDRAVLLIHDMQRYFVEFFPAASSPVTDLVANTVRLRAACQEHGVPVVYTAQPGDMTAQERGLLRDVWGPGMSTNPRHRAIVDELTPGPHDQVFTKWRYSAFHRSGLLASLRTQGRDQLLICGIYAHVGCLITACDAFSHDIQPFLVADAVADFSAEYHRLALWYAAERCAATPFTGDVVQALARARPAAMTGTAG